MERVKNILLIIYINTFVMAALFIIVGEVDVFQVVGTLADDKNCEFVVTTVMELITICAIPLALRMMKFGPVRRIVRKESVDGYQKVAVIRLAILEFVVIVNILFYYFFMNVAFAYMSIIGAISLAFVTPTLQRCMAEYDMIMNDES